jgi:hypothetical protein
MNGSPLILEYSLEEVGEALQPVKHILEGALITRFKVIPNSPDD